LRELLTLCVSFIFIEYPIPLVNMGIFSYIKGGLINENNRRTFKISFKY